MPDHTFDQGVGHLVLTQHTHATMPERMATGFWNPKPFANRLENFPRYGVVVQKPTTLSLEDSARGATTKKCFEDRHHVRINGHGSVTFPGFRGHFDATPDGAPDVDDIVHDVFHVQTSQLHRNEEGACRGWTSGVQFRAALRMASA